MPIIDIIKRIRKEGSKTADNPSGSIIDDYTLFLLDLTKRKIIEHEGTKYPSPPYTYNRLITSIEGKGETIATYIKYDGSPLESSHAVIMQENSLRVRKLSIIGGILNALDFSKELNNGYLGIDAQTRIAFADLLSEFLQGQIHPLMEKEKINDFINGLIEKIQEKSNLDKQELIRQIRTAERYFVAEYKSNQILINEIKTDDGKVIIQVDDYFGNLLTKDQQHEFLRIHSQQEHNRPAWFILLPEWEKTWLLKMIPKSIEENWSRFERISQSSAMSHIPGIQNARMNYLIEFDGNDYTLLSRSFNTSTMVPYEMHVTKDELPKYTEQTARQVLTYLKQQIEVDFKKIWEGIPFDDIRPLIMIQSLLSDTFVAKADTRFATQQRKVIQKINMQNIYPEVEIVAGNDPMNFLRHATALSGPVSKIFGRWRHTEQVLEYAGKFIVRLEEQKQLSSEQQTRLALMKSAREELINLRDEKYKSQGGDRNFVAYKAAYTSILVEAMGGIVSTNCKSGKDRTGEEELYKNSIRYHFNRYKVFPKFDDKDGPRQKFIDIFVPLFNSMKTQEGAAGNTPGSFGLKLDPTMICADIREQLGVSYALSSTLANYNKPDKFLNNEVKSVKVRKASVSIFNKQKSTHPYKQFEQEVSDFIESHPVVRKIPAVNAFKEGIVECQKNTELLSAELLSEWRYHFEDLKENVQEVILLQDDLEQLAVEINEFRISQVQSSTTMNAKQKSLDGHITLLLKFTQMSDTLFLKSNDLMMTVQQVRYQTFPQMRDAFDKFSKEFLQEKDEGQKSKTSNEKQFSVPNNPNSHFAPPSPKPGLGSLIAHFDKLSSAEGKPVINPGANLKVKEEIKPK